MALTVNSVQTGISTFATTDTTMTQSITSVTTANAFVYIHGVVFNSGTQDNSYRTSMVTVDFSLSNELTFTRATAGSQNSLDIYWTVIEFSSGVSVQRGSVSNPNNDNVTISSVNTSRTFPLISMRGNDANSNDYFFTADIDSSTNLSLDNTGTTVFGPGNITWQVITMDDASVQKLTGSITSGDGTVKNITASSVTEANSFIAVTHRNGTTTSSHQANYCWKWRLSSATNVEMERNSADSDTNYYCIYIIEMSEVSSQRSEGTFGASSTDGDSITTVDLTRTIAFNHCSSQHLANNSSTGNMDDTDKCGVYLSSSTQVVAIRSGTTSNSTVTEMEIVQFSDSAGGGFIPFWQHYRQLR